MKNVLWISSTAPFDGIPHAGGQIHNFQVKQLVKDKRYDLRLISFCQPFNIEKLDLEEYGIKSKIINWKQPGIGRLYWAIKKRAEKANPFNRYANMSNSFYEWGVIKSLKSYIQEGFVPDIIILQWTQVVLLIPHIRKVLPDSNIKIVAIEEDVSFLGYKRKYEACKKRLKKLLWGLKFQRLKKIELACLARCNLIINNNKKDEELLHKFLPKLNTWSWSPYFNSMISLERETPNKDILFYGAMDREENWRSAIWFIENVMTRIHDNSVRFIIIGNKPNKEIMRYDSERIQVKGFVEDITPYFKKSLCLVAPLVLGAGVKIKIIEGLSSGIPVLTNRIGIEGIAATDKAEFFYCEKPEEYLECIQNLLDKKIDLGLLSDNAKQLILREYDFARDAKLFADTINAL